MKKKVISALTAFALCSSLALAAAPAIVHAETCSEGHGMDFVERHYEGFSDVNPYDHSCWGYDIYYCIRCQEVHHVNFSVIESHDMCWNSDMTALVCSVCGHEEKAR